MNDLTMLLLIGTGIVMIVYGSIKSCPVIQIVAFLNIPLFKWIYGLLAGTSLAFMLGNGVNPATAGIFHVAAIITEIGFCEWAVHLALEKRKDDIKKWKDRVNATKSWNPGHLVDKLLARF